MVRQIELYDVNGKLVMKAPVSGISGISFSLPNVAPGLYFASLINSNHERTGLGKLIVIE